MAELYGVIFDVDGVIADTEAVNAQASIKVFSDLFGVKGVQRKDFQQGLGRGAEEYIKAAATVHGLKLTDEQVVCATKLRQEYFLQILRQRPLPALPGVLELVRAVLEHKDFRTAIATSSTREKSEAVLRSTKIPYEKMVYITGSDVSNKKPHPELFQKATERLAVRPSNCVVIEDAPNGVEAAHAAGCKCIGVTNLAIPATVSVNLTAADIVVESLAEIDLSDLIKLIQQKNA
jgi:beta-phosphoglucomutase